ncbi:MAG: hypothetical protein ACEY3F_07775 [Wolbachia sp.]
MSGHWDDTPLVAQTTTFVQLCAWRWDDKKRSTGMTPLLGSFSYKH